MAGMRKRLPDDVLAYFRSEGVRGGKLGGQRAAANMTPAQRKARARKAGRASAIARTAKRKADLDAVDAQLSDLEHKRRAHAVAHTKKKHAKKESL